MLKGYERIWGRYKLWYNGARAGKMSVGIALSKEVEEHLIEVSRKKEILISREKKMP